MSEDGITFGNMTAWQKNGDRLWLLHDFIDWTGEPPKAVRIPAGSMATVRGDQHNGIFWVEFDVLPGALIGVRVNAGDA